MADKKKKITPAKKRATGSGAVKAPQKKAGTVAAAKGKTARRPKLTKPASRPAEKKTAVSRKPAAKKVVARKKTPVKAKVAAKAKPKKVSNTSAVADPLKEIKRSLINRRESIVKEAKEEIAKYISGENRQLVDTALDEGDWAVVDISEDINLRRLAAHRKALHDIDESLRKIREGTYGICEE